MNQLRFSLLRYAVGDKHQYDHGALSEKRRGFVVAMRTVRRPAYNAQHRRNLKKYGLTVMGKS